MTRRVGIGPKGLCARRVIRSQVLLAGNTNGDYPDLLFITNENKKIFPTLTYSNIKSPLTSHIKRGRIKFSSYLEEIKLGSHPYELLKHYYLY